MPQNTKKPVRRTVKFFRNSSPKRAAVEDSNRQAAIAASLMASGSGGAMLGAFFSPIGALIGGVLGAGAAYFVEQRNLAR